MDKTQKNKLFIIIVIIFMCILYGVGIYIDNLHKSVEIPILKTSEPITLRFMSSWGGEDNKTEIITELINQFNADHPDILVVNESMSGEDFLFNLKTDFASNHPPDVFGLWPGSDLDKLIEMGKVANLHDAFNEDTLWKSEFDDVIIEDYLSDDELYSIPFEIIYEGLFINKTIFNRAHVAVPRDFEELVSSAKRLERLNYIPIAYNISPEGSFIFQNLIACHGGKAIETDKAVMLESMKKAAVDMKALYDAGAFPEDAFILDDYSRDELFLQGRAAMIVQGSWFITDELGRHDEVIFIPFPYNPQNQVLVHGLGNGNFHISQKAFEDVQRKTAALKFLRYLTSSESAASFEKLPGFKSSLKEPNVTEQTWRYGISEGIDVYVKPIDHYVDRSVWEAEIIRRFPLLFQGDISVEELFKSVE